MRDNVHNWHIKPAIRPQASLRATAFSQKMVRRNFGSQNLDSPTNQLVKIQGFLNALLRIFPTLVFGNSL
ncbi:hypothetical protein Lspi_2231 [Legionella spiritensis]|uniref:Uncharacterized protein n=1 Tax=Legionella spiritensis TaxID=452 RepID=A0A0W0YXJ0_LEGSP|nr:hypothetical protein Lspi_2231 [Legionella spiritensis]